jgi:hypothetical protein
MVKCPAILVGHDFYYLTKCKKYGILSKMRKTKSKNAQAIETAYTILLNHKYRKISDETIKTVVNLLLPYKTEIEIRDIILDLLAYKDTKARVLVKSAMERLEKLVKRR